MVDLRSSKWNPPYDLLFQHLFMPPPFFQMINLFHKLIPSASIFTVIREPISQKLSAYNYLWAPNQPDPSIEKFLKANPYQDQHCRALGIQSNSELNLILRHSNLASKLKVLITERMDEGLVLMKRRFDWDLEDILFIPLLVTCRDHKDQAGKTIPCANRSLLEDPTVRKTFEEQTVLDRTLYEHFRGVLEEEIEMQDSSFHEEVDQLRRVNKQLFEFCKDELEEFVADKKKYRSLKISFCFKYVLDDGAFTSLIYSSATPSWLDSVIESPSNLRQPRLVKGKSQHFRRLKL